MTMRPTFIEGTTPAHTLPTMLDNLLQNGIQQPSRNGDTLEVRNACIYVGTSLHPYMVTPHRKASLPAQIAETMWVLSGRNDVAFLRHYLPRAAQFSDDGATWRGGYGPRLRNWSGGTDLASENIDQLGHVVDLLIQDKDTRRAVMAIYDPAVDTADGKDIPCNNWLHFLHRDDALHLHVATRSNDAMWGWSGINAFEWSILLQLVANLTGLRPGSITYSVTSLHLYGRHFEKAARIVEARKTADANGGDRLSLRAAPALGLPDRYCTIEQWDALTEQWFAAEAAIRLGWASANRLVDTFPEPLLRSWLVVLQAWWSGNDYTLLAEYGGTDLSAAYAASPVNPEGLARRKAAKAAEGAGKAVQAQYRHQGADRPKPEWMPFVQYVTELHAEKDKAYGDSWKRRGEQMAIMANIARKVDRLGVTDNHDTAADTAIDLLVYLVKYRLWLVDEAGAKLPQGMPGSAKLAPSVGVKLSDGVNHVNYYLQALWDQRTSTAAGVKEIEEALKYQFDANLTKEVEMQWQNRDATVELMIRLALQLAVKRYHQLGNATRQWNPEA